MPRRTPTMTIGKKDTSTLFDFGVFFSSHDNTPIFLSVNGGYRTLNNSAQMQSFNCVAKSIIMQWSGHSTHAHEIAVWTSSQYTSDSDSDSVY